MPQYRVRDGQVVNVNGEPREGGSVIDLPAFIAEDIALRGKVDAVDALGRVIDPEPASTLDEALAIAQRHEHISILQRERAACADRLKTLDERIAVEQAWNDEQTARLSQSAPTDPPLAADDKE